MENRYGSYLVYFILLIIVLEIFFICFLYFSSDEVECNYIWCEFKLKDEKTTNENNIINITQKCYKNGEMINCSTIPGENDRYKI